MGAFEAVALAAREASLKYHPVGAGALTMVRESGSGTASGGQFDWGGRLLKSNGGAQRFPQTGWQSVVRVQWQKGA